MVTFDSAERGTSRADWHEWGGLEALGALHLAPGSSLAVVAAHPDDETLGAGGLISAARAVGLRVVVIVVTDGAASHSEEAISRIELRNLRSRELHAATRLLGPEVRVVELGFADGQTDRDRDDIRAALDRAIPDDAFISAPWRGDGHRDHRIVGELCSSIAESRGKQLLEYPIWMWHWSSPGASDVPWAAARAFGLSADSLRAKNRAIEAYRSQTTSSVADPPVLRSDFIEHFRADREVYFVTEPEGSTKPQSYFDNLYAANPDPWRLASRWYETRKRDITVASLPRARFGSALEIGSSVGELTAALAPRCNDLLAVDISSAAVQSARARTAGLSGVRVEHRDAVDDFPAGPFDLIVLSEVAYYWDEPTLSRMIGLVLDHLSPDGIVLACHWKHEVADYPLSGNRVHELLRAQLTLSRTVLHEEEDFILEVFASSPDSVARREGLLS